MQLVSKKVALSAGRTDAIGIGASMAGWLNQ